MCSSMLTTAVARTKPATFYGTYCGGPSQEARQTSSSPFWWWDTGLFKRLFKRTKVGSLRGIAEVVQQSGKSNEAQLVVDEMGDVQLMIGSAFCLTV